MPLSILGLKQLSVEKYLPYVADMTLINTNWYDIIKYLLIWH